MNTHHSLNYIEFGAKDLGAIKAFYSAVFGWEFTDFGPDYVAFKDADEREGEFTTDRVVGGGPLVVLFSERLEETKALVEKHGGTTQDIYAFPGGQRFLFTDPSGNELAVWSE